MSVILHGFEMPETCEVCDFCMWSKWHQTGLCTLNDQLVPDYLTSVGENCPLEAIPTPHGRLIDAGALDLDREVELSDG